MSPIGLTFFSFIIKLLEVDAPDFQAFYLIVQYDEGNKIGS